MPKSLFTIRKKKKEKHPQIIVGADRTSFESVGLTHSKKDRGKNNLQLTDNPDKEDSRPSYVKKRIIRSFKFNFTKAFENYSLTDKDIDELIRFLNSKKNKKK